MACCRGRGHAAEHGVCEYLQFPAEDRRVDDGGESAEDYGYVTFFGNEEWSRTLVIGSMLLARGACAFSL